MARSLRRELPADRGRHALRRPHRLVDVAAHRVHLLARDVPDVRARLRRADAEGADRSVVRTVGAARLAMEALNLLLHGFAVLITWKTLSLMMVGLLLGVFVGVLPGLGGPNGVAILLPLTFTMDPTAAIVMLSCIYWGALFGGAITSILFNIPGEAWSVEATFDG